MSLTFWPQQVINPLENSALPDGVPIPGRRSRRQRQRSSQRSRVCSTATHWLFGGRPPFFGAEGTPAAILMKPTSSAAKKRIIFSSAASGFLRSALRLHTFPPLALPGRRRPRASNWAPGFRSAASPDRLRGEFASPRSVLRVRISCGAVLFILGEFLVGGIFGGGGGSV
jgi:hypothetical protein